MEEIIQIYLRYSRKNLQKQNTQMSIPLQQMIQPILQIISVQWVFQQNIL